VAAIVTGKLEDLEPQDVAILTCSPDTSSVARVLAAKRVPSIEDRGTITPQCGCRCDRTTRTFKGKVVAVRLGSVERYPEIIPRGSLRGRMALAGARLSLSQLA
jgi:hypothetical protein